MSVYVCCVHCVCLCSLCLCVGLVCTWWQIRRCWKVQRQQLCLGTLPTWGSAQPRCKVNSFNFLHPSFRRNLELICQRRSSSVEGWKVAKKRSICDTPYTLYLPSLVISLPVAALSCDKVGLPTWPLTLNMMAKTNSKKCRHIHCSLSISTSLTFHGTNSNKKMKMAAKTHYQTNKYALQHEYSNLCKSFLGIRKSFNVAPNSQELKTEKIILMMKSENWI